MNLNNSNNSLNQDVQFCLANASGALILPKQRAY